MTPTEFIEKWFSYVRNRRKQEMTDDLTAMLAEREQAIGEECAKVALSFQTEDSEPPYRITPWAEMAKEIAAAIRAATSARTPSGRP